MTYKNFSITLAKKAGKIIRDNFSAGMAKDWKDDGSPVTKTDTKVNKLVIDSVKKYFPAHDVLGEEESYRPNNSKFLWVCDPVDGTMPFSMAFQLAFFLWH